jgi:hypothetical protein
MLNEYLERNFIFWQAKIVEKGPLSKLVINANQGRHL